MRVTVFGGSQPKPGDPAYEEAFKFGHLLGKAGFDVLTGGYIGTMEAVSRGASEAGGYVIGVTCDEIETWRPVAPNPWVKQELRYSTLRERLFALIDNCEAAFALPGGIGTLEEITVMWAQLRVHAISPRPLILIGSGWKSVYDSFYETLGNYVSKEDRQWLYFEPDSERAFLLFNTLISEY